MLRNLDKHKKYKTAYKPNDFYWGLGVEHETYIESSKLKQITLKELKENRAAERYCVDYYSVYNKESLDNALDGLFEQDQKILLPILLNSHTFQKTDINGEHKLTFERVPKPNTKFSGKTIFEWMKQENPDIFVEDYEKSYIFDGDTIEFMTQQFYKAKVQDVVDELATVEKEFMRALNSLPREGVLKTYAPFQIAKENYPFAAYLTNLKNNAMFNNGTIHINVTLPTKLNEKAEVADFELFQRQHQNYARAIQWISPLLVARYGAHDPLCESKTNGLKYSAGSQRVAVSRYIGLGTYDTDKMEVGKILTRGRDKLEDIDWYKSFHEKVDYKFLDVMGMDINFNKHYCHGLEFRILESVPLSDLQNILYIIVHLADFSLDILLTNPKKSQLWHKIAENCVHNGRGYFMDASDQNELYELFGLTHLSKEPIQITEVLTIITEFLAEKYKNSLCTQYMIRGEYISKPNILTPSSLSPVIEVDTISTTPLTEKAFKTNVATAIVPVPIATAIVPVPVAQPAPVAQPVIDVKPKHKFIWCC
jgi:hypothetical protein